MRDFSAPESAARAPRVLFITAFHPGGAGEIGAGEAISEDSLRAMHAAGKEIHVLCLAPPSQCANPQVVKICASYQTLHHTTLQALMGVLWGLAHGSFIAPWMFSRVSPRNIQAVKKALQERPIDEIWLDFPSSLGFAPHLAGTHIEYFVHDVVSQKVGRRKLLAFLQPFVKQVEKRLLSFVTKCVTLSGKDEILLRNLGFAGETIVSPPSHVRVGTVVAGMPVAKLLESFSGRENLVFFGNMGRPENHWSIVHFLLFSFRKIRHSHPDVQFWILGLSPRRLLRVLGHLMSGVHVVGAVDDPIPAFRAATLCVAPLRLGAGVKIKVLQMIDAGATVVASPVGGEGIAACADLIVVAYDEIPDHVSRLLSERQDVSIARSAGA